MTKKDTNKKKVFKYDLWRLLQLFFSMGIIISLILLTIELAKPMEITQSQILYVDPNKNSSIGPSEINPLTTSENEGIMIRPGLFKPETQLGDKPMADKTVQTIISKLTLQCIMDMNGQPVGYVKIQGEGLKKCCVGDTIKDLFTVVSISEKSMVISIADHKVKLEL